MNSDEEIKYTLLLEEAREKYRKIDKVYAEIKNRMLLFLTADIALLAFFFTDIRECLPNELYGIIFFAIGVISIITSIGILFSHYRAIYDWPSPVGPVEIEHIKHKSGGKEILQVAIDDYMDAYEAADRIARKYAKAANWSLLLFVAGVTILLIIKFFKGSI